MYYDPKPITVEELQQEKTDFVAVHKENIDKLQGISKAPTIQEVPTCKIAFLEWLLGNEVTNWKRMILAGWVAFLVCLAIWLLTMGMYSATTTHLEHQNELYKQNLKAVSEREQEARRDLEEYKSRLSRVLDKQEKQAGSEKRQP